jgi:TPR repeat protein
MGKLTRASIVAFATLITLSTSQAAAVNDERPGGPIVAAAPAAVDPDDRLQRAEAGDVEAMNELGVLYLLAGTTPGDRAVGLYWLQRAVDGGSANAMHNLAWMYLNGVGVPRDYANALAWFKRAADRGNVYAAYIVAAMAENGLGTPSDMALARSMYRRAAEAGVVPAMAWVSEDLLSRGTGSALVEAYAWLQVASQSRLDERSQIVVLARMEKLRTSLGPLERDEARIQAARIVAAMRSTPANRAPAASARPSSPHPAGHGVSIHHRLEQDSGAAPTLQRTAALSFSR